ncbi:MAG: cyclic nucleotide-binding domain-containing protein [Proteobacteria bacterium]|jgi:CRP/FNR family transcriptional regulator/CRP/FNR family cyclic AMP-dependent transcriptional regulator|nr:cyclic nucleotide-binding domain-containing protein [Pseudomonadota bacterium]
MHWKVRRDFLSRVEIFAGLGQRDLKAVAKSCGEATYGDGEYLCRQGERGVAAFLIVSGKIRVENEMADGEAVVLAELGQGAVVGEMAIIDGDERTASIRAVGDVMALVLTQWSMQGLLKERPSIAASMLPVVVRRFRNTTAELRKRDGDLEHARRTLHD